MLISPMDGSLRLVESTSPVWHIDAVRGPSTPSLRAERNNPERGKLRNGLLRRGACQRARVRATRWLLAMTAEKTRDETMFEKGLLAGKRILVTCGSSRVGAAIGRLFPPPGPQLLNC